MSFDPYQTWLKIPDRGRPPNHYELLGLAWYESDQERIQKAYQTRYAHVRRYGVGDHGESASRLLEELSKALVELSDPVKRAAYDERLRGESAVEPNSGSLEVGAEPLAGEDLLAAEQLPDAAPLPSSRLPEPGREQAGGTSLAGATPSGLPGAFGLVAVAAVAIVLLTLGGLGAWTFGPTFTQPSNSPAPRAAVPPDASGDEAADAVTTAATPEQTASARGMVENRSAGNEAAEAASDGVNSRAQENGGEAASPPVDARAASSVAGTADHAAASSVESAVDSLMSLGSGLIAGSDPDDSTPPLEGLSGVAAGDSPPPAGKSSRGPLPAGQFAPGTADDAAASSVESAVDASTSLGRGLSGGPDLDDSAGLPSAGRPVAAGEPSDGARHRVWWTEDESYSVRAEYLGFHDNLVMLRRVDDDRQLDVEIERLSEADRRYVRREEGTRLDGVLREARRAIDGGDVARARRLLVTDTVEEDIRADFLAGLLEAIEAKDPLEARKHFITCVRRQPEHAPSLNNLACAEIRAGKSTDAVKHWRMALEIEPGIVAVKHNLILVGRLVSKRRVQLGRTLFAQVQELSSGASVRSGQGWQYLDYSTPPDSQGDYQFVALWSGRDASDRTCMQCSGTQVLTCPIPQCKRGKIYVSRSRVVVGGPGGVISNSQKVPIPCKGCGGRGQLQCPFCSGGRDRDL